MSSAQASVAAFDFDGTLSKHDCVLPFLDHLIGRKRLAGRLLLQPGALIRAGVRRDRDLAKAIAVRAAFAGRDEAAVERAGAEFAAKILAGAMRDDTPKRLAWHQRQGHRVVLVSASLGAYLRPLGSALGVDGVLCTEAVVGADGRYTGELVGSNCRGAEKVRRLRAWLADRQLDNAELWAYGDSAGDRELLSCARHHHFVKDRSITAIPEGVV